MSEIEELKQQVKKIRDLLIYFDEKLLNNQISEETYKMLTEKNVALLKSLESQILPPNPEEEKQMQKDFEELIERARKNIIVHQNTYGSPMCPVCTNSLVVTNCYKHVQVNRYDISYGYWCRKKNCHFSDGTLPIPEYIQSYLVKTRYFEVEKSKEDE